MIAAGIDQSLSSAGVAVLNNGYPVVLRTVGTPPDIKDWHHRVKRITRQTWQVVKLLESKGRPDLVAIEAPLTFGSDGDAYDRYSLFVEIMRQLDAWKVPTVVVHNLTRCKWATGKGGKSSKELTREQHKREVMLAVRKTWEQWAAHISNDDIADALTLAEIASRGCGDEPPVPLRRRHIEAMHNSIDWPSNFGAKPEPMQVGAPR